MFDSFLSMPHFFFLSIGEVPEKNDNVLSIEKKKEEEKPVTSTITFTSLFGRSNAGKSLITARQNGRRMGPYPASRTLDQAGQTVCSVRLFDVIMCDWRVD